MTSDLLLDALRQTTETRERLPASSSEIERATDALGDFELAHSRGAEKVFPSTNSKEEREDWSALADDFRTFLQLAASKSQDTPAAFFPQ